MAEKEGVVVVEEAPSIHEVGSMLKSMHSPKRTEPYPGKNKSGGILGRLNGLFQREKGRLAKEIEQDLRLLRRDPENTKLRGKLAEMDQKRGEMEKAVAEYLKIA